MPHQTWVLGADAHVGLSERGNALLDPGPIDAVNGSCLTNAVLEMRQGMQNEDLSGSGFTGRVVWMGHYMTNQGGEELWAAADNNGTPALARKVNSVWSPVAFSDVPNIANLLYMQGCSMNGKFFLAYDSDVNRLHVWDGTNLRRVGLTGAIQPALTALGAGTLTFTRWYRVRNNHTAVSGVIVRRSEPSIGVVGGITSALGIRVAKNALSGDGETHWEVEAATASAGPWYRIATLPVATPSYDDTNATIPTANPSDELGSHDVPPSAKYLSTDGLSLMMGAAWETTVTPGTTFPKQNRVWFTPPLGSSDIGDDERIVNTLTVHGWTDIGDAGPITSLGGPVYGETIVTKKQTVAKLTPTGNVDAPYALSVVTNAMGCVDQRLMTMGEVGGVPAILFADVNAVYAMSGQGGIACLSESMGAATRGMTIVSDPGLLVYDPLERVVFLQTSNAKPTVTGTYRNFMFDAYKKRWEGFVLGGTAGGWILGVSKLGISTILGGGGMEIFNGCYAEQNGERRLYLCGKNTKGQPSISSRGGQAVLDIDQPFTSIVRFRKVFKPGFKATIGCPTIYYTNPQGDQSTGILSATVSYIRDFDEVRAQTVQLLPTDYTSRLATRTYTFEGISSADVSVLDLVLSLRFDGAPYESPLTPAITCVVVPFTSQEPLAQ